MIPRPSPLARFRRLLEELRLPRKARELREEQRRLETMVATCPPRLQAHVWELLAHVREQLGDADGVRDAYVRSLASYREVGPSWKVDRLEDLLDPPSVSEPLLMATHRGREVPVRVRAFVLGRSAACTDLQLQSSSVAREHAVVVRENHQWQLRDLGSTNGTRRMLGGGEAIDVTTIEDGDVFQLGDEEVRFTLRSGSP